MWNFVNDVHTKAALSNCVVKRLAMDMGFNLHSLKTCSFIFYPWKYLKNIPQGFFSIFNRFVCLFICLLNVHVYMPLAYICAPYMCATCMLCPWRSEESAWSSGTRVTGSREPPNYGCWKPNFGSSARADVPLTARALSPILPQGFPLELMI